MSITLVATIGGPGSNSYQDADAVQAILDGVPNTDAWDALRDDDDKDTFCVYATTMLEAFGYRGTKVSTTQALAWPRFGVCDPDYGDGQEVYLSSTAVPRRILRGHAMLCLELARAGTAEVWGVDASLDVIRKVVGPLETEYAPRQERRTGLRRYPSVWREIGPLLAGTQARTVERA